MVGDNWLFLHMIGCLQAEKVDTLVVLACDWLFAGGEGGVGAGGNKATDRQAGC